MIFAIPILLLLSAPTIAKERGYAQNEITCDDVRDAVRRLGRAGALALGRRHGMTPEQEARARACLR